MSTHPAIGVFDSGLGGLTVVKELIRQLPNENIIYYGDTARVPYGTKSKESIIRFSKENTELLIKKNVKMIVVACNSSSSYAMTILKRRYNRPILGVISPGAYKAANSTTNNKIGVIATAATVKSGQYAKLIKKFNAKAQVISQACPLFVPLVEEGWFQSEATKQIVATYLKGLKKAKVDTVILGCTHYPLLKPVIQQAMGRDVRLVDSAKEVATKVKELLGQHDLLRKKGKGKYKFLVSDKPMEFGKIAKTFLGQEISAVKVNPVIRLTL